ncbi:hypothetical protein GN956_G17059 [Arapaima gigas]
MVGECVPPPGSGRQLAGLPQGVSSRYIRRSQVSCRDTRGLGIDLNAKTKTPLLAACRDHHSKIMKGLLSALVLLVALSSSTGKPEKQATQKLKRIPQTLSRGWGDQLIWAQTYEEGLHRSKSSNKPLMVIFHLENCPHSLALKKAFAENKEIQKMADEDFILLNLVFETTDKHLSPDGQYVPRILFVGKSSPWPYGRTLGISITQIPVLTADLLHVSPADPSLTVRADITGRYSNRLYAYEPSDISLLIDNMKKAKKLLKTEL